MPFHPSATTLTRLAVCLLLLCGLAISAVAQQQDKDKKTTGRVQKLTYEFKEAGKEMEYALFVPSGYDKEKKAPLMVALHGLGGNPQQMIRSKGLTEQAEKYGYVVVAPMGYNSSGWYGALGKGKGFGGKGFGKDKGKGGDAPENLGELSEQDVMNVLKLVRKGYSIDDKRIYLLGHSMGGAGTYHLGAKYADTWAGLAPIAAATGQPKNVDKLKTIPVIVVHGDKDTVVNVSSARRCVEKLKEQKIVHEYVEFAGGGHGDVISKGMPKVFEFFEKQHKEKQDKKDEKKQDKKEEKKQPSKGKLPDSVKLEADVAYAGTKNTQQRLNLLLPKTPKDDKPLPVIVYVHGGAWLGGDRAGGHGKLARYVADGEYAGVSVGYRLTNEAIWPAQIHDCKAAIRWIRANARKYNLDPDRIGVVGESAGGHLAAMLGTSGGNKDVEGDLGEHKDQSSRVSCVVDHFGPADLLAMQDGGGKMDHDGPNSPEGKLVGGRVKEKKEVARAASPVTYVAKDNPPFLIIHGNKDPLVPFDQSERLSAALKKAKVDCYFVTVDGGGHGGFRNPEVGKRERQFFEKYLRGVKATISEEKIPDQAK